MRLNDRIAIVTGGGRGIGQAYSKRLAKEGAAVLIADINHDDAQATAEEINQTGGRAKASFVDVGDRQSIQDMVDTCRSAFGRVDILVNNAALYSVLNRTSFMDIQQDEWDRVMSINVRSILQCAQAVYPLMKENGRGKIINISSGAIFTASSEMAHYVASKMAVVGLTRALAREMGRDGICVNAVTPGATASGVNERISPLERLEKFAGQRCIPRVQVPTDLEGTIVFLASDDSNFITGQILNVDGGTHFL